jgi:hypothetical protein
VAELANGIKNAGYHTAAFDGSRFNSGVYYYSLEIDGKNITKKMLLDEVIYRHDSCGTEQKLSRVIILFGKKCFRCYIGYQENNITPGGRK